MTYRHLFDWILVAFVILAVGFSGVTKVQARVSISPITKDNKGFISSFVYKLEAGQSITDKALIYNLDTVDTTARVQARDALFSDEGVFTLQPTSQSQLFNQWIRFDTTTISLPSETNIELPFTLTLPNDIASGEYAGGISVSQTQDPSVGVNVQSEVASKVFVLVGKDFRSSSKIEDLRPIHPSLKDFDQLVEKYSITNKNLHLLVQGINDGNTFSDIKGQYEISMAGGVSESGEFSKNLYPNQNSTLLIPTQIILQPGPVTVTLTYTVTPTNLAYLPEGFDYDQSEKKLESRFEYQASDYYKGVENQQVSKALQIRDIKQEKPFWQALLLNLSVGVAASVVVVYGGMWVYRKYRQYRSQPDLFAQVKINKHKK